MTPNTLVPTGVGSTDWAGGTAPGGGVHTGVSVVVMIDGTTYVVDHGVPEIAVKVGSAPTHTAPNWVAFDVPFQAVPIILNTGNIEYWYKLPLLPRHLNKLYPATNLYPAGPRPEAQGGIEA